MSSETGKILCFGSLLCPGGGGRPLRRDRADKSFTNTAKRRQNRRIDTPDTVGTSEKSECHEELVVIDVPQIRHGLNRRPGVLEWCA